MDTDDIVTRKIMGHDYRIVPFPPQQGQRVMFRVMALLGPSFVSVIESILGAQELTGAVLGVLLAPSPEAKAAARSALGEVEVPSSLTGGDEKAGARIRASLLDVDIAGVLASVRLGALGGDLANALRRLAAEDEDLVGALVGTCTRDGLPLSNPVHYAAAFRRNYRELLMVLGVVLDVNGLFRQPST